MRGKDTLSPSSAFPVSRHDVSKQQARAVERTDNYSTFCDFVKLLCTSNKPVFLLKQALNSPISFILRYFVQLPYPFFEGSMRFYIVIQPKSAICLTFSLISAKFVSSLKTRLLKRTGSTAQVLA